MATALQAELDRLHLADGHASDDDAKPDTEPATSTKPADTEAALAHDRSTSSATVRTDAIAVPSPIVAVPPKPSFASPPLGSVLPQANALPPCPALSHPSPPNAPVPLVPAESAPPSSPRGPAALTSPAARAQLEAMRAGARAPASAGPELGSIRPPPHGAAVGSSRVVRPMGGPMGMRAAGNQPLPSKLPPSLQAKMDAVSGRVSLHPFPHPGLR